jgi:isopentenyl diphosphate isomerase/L-lactate dehydrogenase-like FMN-dependent dehydrogenase
MHAFGFDLKVLRPDPLVTVEQYRRAAMRRWPKMVQRYVDGGADGETALRANRSAFDRWAVRSRVLTGHNTHDLSRTVAGHELDVPIMLAPTGVAGLSHWRADIDVARAADTFGTKYVASTLTSWSIEEIAAASQSPHFFQLYPRQGDLTADLMRRSWNTGNRVMFVTVDTPVKGNRVGERLTGMGIPPTLSVPGALNMARHPRWVYNVLRRQRIGGRNLVSGGGISAAVESIDIQFRELSQATLNWDDFDWMREQWRGRLYIKGVLDVDDAKRAVALGADGVVVSNHGGRQLGRSPATLESLPAIVSAVGDKTEVLFDGGIRTGSDVIIALCLGARAVLIGRPYLYGAAVAGQKGVEGVLRILRDEMDQALTLMGVGDIDQLDRTWLIDRRPAGASDQSCPGEVPSVENNDPLPDGVRSDE